METVDDGFAMSVVGNGVTAMRRVASVAWYCVRVDHVATAPKQPPVLTIHDRGWAYCRSGVRPAEHTWAPTRGVPLGGLYQLMYRDSAPPPRSALDWIDALRVELNDTVGWSSCVLEIARERTPLRISFEEARATEAGAASVTVELADAHGSVGKLTLTDRNRDSFSGEDIELLRAIVAQYAGPIRDWLRSSAGIT